jgi:hypothetical protein
VFPGSAEFHSKTKCSLLERVWAWVELAWAWVELAWAWVVTAWAWAWVEMASVPVVVASDLDPYR